MKRTTLVTSFLVLATLHGTVLAEDGETTVRTGDHFEVVCHFESPRCADEALATVEALWKEAAALYGLGSRRPDKPLVINLYRDTADYEAAEQGLTKGAFKRNLAFAHFATKSAHVAMQPEVSDEVLDAHGLPLQTRNLLAHEAAHLVRFDNMPNFEDHPDWFGDGAGQFLKYEALKTLDLIDGLMEDPMSGKSYLRVQRLLKDGKLPAVDALFRDERADLGFNELYAVKRVLFEWLATDAHRKKLDKVRKAIRRMGGGSDFTKRVREQVEKAFGKKRYEGLDEEWHAWLEEQKPAWDEVIRSLDAQGTTWRQYAFPSSNAVAWRTQRAGAPPYRVGGRLEILPSYGKQMNLLLARSDAGFVSIAFTADYGVNVFDFQSADGGKWNNLLGAKCPAVARGAPFEIEARIEDRKLTVSVAGTSLGTVEIPAHHDLSGPWGVGAQRGAAGRWIELRQSK